LKCENIFDTLPNKKKVFPMTVLRNGNNKIYIYGSDLPNSRAHKYFKWFPIIIKEPLCCLCMFGWKYIITIDIKGAR
jgi:hypothetical protein